MCKCPNCGYCPHCGRSNNYYPCYPYYHPYPYYYNYGITLGGTVGTATGGSFTVQTDAGTDLNMFSSNQNDNICNCKK